MACVTALWDDESAFAGPPIPRNDGPDFGVTYAKQFAPYVYSTRGALIHRVIGVRLYWYGLINGSQMRRLKRPAMFFLTACGNSFVERKRRLRVSEPSARVCHVPAADAVLCGRCHGQHGTFSKHGEATRTGLTKRAARMRLGCLPEV